MRKTTCLAALLLAPLAALHAADAPKPAAATETDQRPHADGQGWRLDKARITDPARPRVLLIGDSILNGYLRAVIQSLDGKAYVEVIKAKLPKAKIIWASSTPVTAKGKPTELDPAINPTIVEHNRMAAKVMAEMNVPVNDFYSPLANKLNMARGDQFHWTAPAYDLLAKTVVESVLRELGTLRPPKKD